MTTNLYQELIDEAAFYVGVSEQDGKPNAGPNIEDFQRIVDGRAMGEPWCLCFVQYCVEKVAERHGTHSWLPGTEHVLTLWKNVPRRHKRALSFWQTMPDIERVSYPHKGWLMVWQHAGTSSGHIGIVEGVDNGGKYVNTIEGNTGPDDKTVVREGDGVFRKRRPLGDVGSMVLLGFIDVWGEKS